jgi:antirestriction protein ArdC
MQSRTTSSFSPKEGAPITGSYDDTLIAELRDAWSHRVVAELSRTEHRYAYAREPFRVEHSLRRIVRKLGSVEDEEQTGAA